MVRGREISERGIPSGDGPATFKLSEATFRFVLNLGTEQMKVIEAFTVPL